MSTNSDNMSQLCAHNIDCAHLWCPMGELHPHTACQLILHVTSFCIFMCIHVQVLRCQPENGAVAPDQPPVALMRPGPTGSPSPLDPSALSQHLATQELQAPKVSSAG